MLDNPLFKQGTRRLHVNSGEVWRVQCKPLPSLDDDYRMVIVRERDGRERAVSAYYWLGGDWGRPTSRAGARR